MLTSSHGCDSRSGVKEEVMDAIKVGEGENPDNDNGLGAGHCSCGATENGGPHTLQCVMEQEGLRTVTINLLGSDSGSHP